MEKIIDAIYKEVADKTLKIGCAILLPNHHNKGPYIHINEEYFFNGSVVLNYKEQIVDIDEGDIQVIGNPVMIGDVLDWLNEVWFPSDDARDETERDSNGKSIEEWQSELSDIEYNIIKYWGYPRKPIHGQSLECIEYVYNVIHRKEGNVLQKAGFSLAEVSQAIMGIGRMDPGFDENGNLEETTNDWIDEACTEYMNNEALAFQNNNTFDTEKSFRQAIEKHMPKQELIPLDTDKITKELMEGLLREWQKDGSRQKIIKQILSKYGTTPQKKFTEEKNFEEKIIGKASIQEVLKNNMLL